MLDVIYQTSTRKARSSLLTLLFAVTATSASAQSWQLASDSMESVPSSIAAKPTPKKVSASKKKSLASSAQAQEPAPETAHVYPPEDSQSSKTNQNDSIGDATVYIGSYSYKGFEAGFMAAATLFEKAKTAQAPGLGVALEVGAHRARWSYQHVGYNRFAVTGDGRFDIKAFDAITPYIAAGIGQHREWYHGSSEALSETYLNLKVGSFFNLTSELAIRLEYAPTMNSLRLGSTLKI